MLRVLGTFKHRVPPVVANSILLGLYSQFEVLLRRNIDLTGNSKIIFFMPVEILMLRLRANSLFHSSVKKTPFWVKKKVVKSLVNFVIKFKRDSA